MAEINPFYRKKESARLIPGDHPNSFKLYMIDSKTDRALNEINMREAQKKVVKRVDDVLQDYKDLQKVINLKLRTIGEMTQKLQKRKYKIVV